MRLPLYVKEFRFSAKSMATKFGALGIVFVDEMCYVS